MLHLKNQQASLKTFKPIVSINRNVNRTVNSKSTCVYFYHLTTRWQQTVTQMLWIVLFLRDQTAWMADKEFKHLISNRHNEHWLIVISIHYWMFLLFLLQYHLGFNIVLLSCLLNMETCGGTCDTWWLHQVCRSPEFPPSSCRWAHFLSHLFQSVNWKYFVLPRFLKSVSESAWWHGM